MDVHAYHEAGHAVLALHSGLEFDHVSIDEHGPGLHGAAGDPMVSLAGPAAENHYRANIEMPLLDPDPEDYLTQEEVDPAVYYLSVSRGLHDDYREALDLLWDHEDRAASINLAKRKLRDAAQKCDILVEQHWRRIDLLARNLVRERKIVYADAERLFRSDG